VDVLVSHLALIGEKEIEAMIKSPIRTIVATNSHPNTQHVRIQQNPKFKILDLSGEIFGHLAEILPKA
jgi:phosphoribosylpyrophosphate synthetase